MRQKEPPAQSEWTRNEMKEKLNYLQARLMESEDNAFIEGLTEKNPMRCAANQKFVQDILTESAEQRWKNRNDGLFKYNGGIVFPRGVLSFEEMLSEAQAIALEGYNHRRKWEHMWGSPCKAGEPNTKFKGFWVAGLIGSKSDDAVRVMDTTLMIPRRAEPYYLRWSKTCFGLTAKKRRRAWCAFSC